MKEIIFTADENLIAKAESILDAEGLDLELAMHILLKRIVKEETIAFLLKNSAKKFTMTERNFNFFERETRVPSARNLLPINFPENLDRRTMTKNMSIRLFREKGFTISNNVTFASKNRGAYNYWANPEYKMLSVDWNIILNDWLNKKLYLFSIPANTLIENQLVARNDKNYLIDLQIMYNDTTFTDNRSGVSFAKFLSAELQY